MTKKLEIDEEKILRYVRGLLPRHRDGYETLWQSIIASWQFKDLQKALAYYVRFKDKAYIAEAKSHLADLFIQVVALCLVLELDPAEILDLGKERLEEHAKIEIYPRLWSEMKRERVW